MRRSDREITSRDRIDAIIRGCEVCWEFDASTLASTRVWRVAIEELTGKQSSLKAS